MVHDGTSKSVKSRSSRQALLTAIALSLVGQLTLGCGGTTATQTSNDAALPPGDEIAGDEAALFRGITDRYFAQSRVTAYSTVLDAGPNVVFVDESDQPAFQGGVVSDAVILSSELTVVDSRGLFFDSGETRIVDSDDPTADAIDVFLEVAVDEWLATSERVDGTGRPKQVVVRIRVGRGTEVPVIADDLKSLSGVVLWLFLDPEVTEGSTSFVVTEEGVFFGVVNQEGVVEFPILGEPPAEFLPTAFTLDELRRELATPRRILPSQAWLDGR